MSTRWRRQPTQEETTRQISQRPVCAMTQRVVNVDRINNNKNSSWIKDSECTTGTIVMCFEIPDDDHPSNEQEQHMKMSTPKSKTWSYYIDKSKFVQNVLGNKMGFTIDVQFFYPRCSPYSTVCPIQETQYTIRIGGIENKEYVTEWLNTLGKYFHTKIKDKNINITNSGFSKVCSRPTQSFFNIEGTLPKSFSNLNEQTMLSQVLLATNNNADVAQTDLNDMFDTKTHKSHLFNIKLTHDKQTLTPWIWTKHSNQALIMPIVLEKKSSE